MQGLYGLDFKFPPAPDHGFVLRSPSQEDDLILRAHGGTCPRFEKVSSALEDAEDTKALYEELDAWIEEKFYGKLRQIVNMPDADTKTMHKVVDFIDWADKNDYKLKIDLTEEDMRFIRIADEAG